MYVAQPSSTYVVKPQQMFIQDRIEEKDNSNFIKRRLYYAIDPSSPSYLTKYGLMHEGSDNIQNIVGLLEHAKNFIVGNKRHIDEENNSESAWKLYLGMSQNQLEESPYRPSESEDDKAKYYRYKGKERSDIQENSISWFNNYSQRPNVDLKKISHTIPGLGHVKLGLAPDSTYISIYDRWDHAPHDSKFLQKIENKLFNPWEYYDKFYIDKNEYKNTGKAIALPEHKAYGGNY